MTSIPFESCPVVELRRYTLHPGALPDLLDVFERHLIEPQEECGMTVGGTFADEDDPNTFTWLRGFADHGARVRALKRFYGGPVWARHSSAANATMVDSDDVFLLRSTQPVCGPPAAVPRGGADDRPRVERALIGTFGPAAAPDAFEDWFATTVVPALEDVLEARVTAWRADPRPNPFPGLPVRSEPAVAFLAVFPDGDARNSAAARLAAAQLDLELDRRTRWRRTFRLAPTARSAHPVAHAHW